MSNNIGIHEIENIIAKTENTTNSPTYSLKQSIFNPTKGSPNLFMSKLMFRLQNYSNEEALNDDPLMI